MTIDKRHIIDIACELARRNFYAYCRIMLPQVYKPERKYLKIMCDTLQQFHEDKLLNSKGNPYKGVALKAIPRAGKTTTANLFATWVLSKNHQASVISVSYNETLASRASKTVRGYIDVRSVDETITNSMIFPDTKLKHGDASMQLWSLEGSPLISWLATSPGGTATGLGVRAGGYLIFDDLVKNAEEALNPRIHEEHDDYYWNTMASRVEKGGKQLYVATPWAYDDLQSRLIRNTDDWFCLSFPATKTYPNNPMSDDDMLDPSVLPCDEYIKRKANADPFIFHANYDLEPMQSDPTMLLYPNLKTYRPGLEPDTSETLAVIDPAGKGSDNFACIVYTVKEGFGYIKDILYDDSHGEVTEPLCAKMLDYHKVSVAYIEENGAGEGAKRAIEKLLRAMGNTSTELSGFNQGSNKEARIRANSTAVCNTVLFPESWNMRWPRAYKDITTTMRIGRWTHDDIQDCLTMLVEKSLSKPDFFFL